MTAIVEPDAGAARACCRRCSHGSDGLRVHGGARASTSSATPPRVRRRHRPVGRRSDDAAAFAQWARVHRPDLGVILLRDDGRQRRAVDWRCAAACARSSRPGTSPASPRPSSALAAWPARSSRRSRARPRQRAERPCRGRGRGRGRCSAAAERPQGKLITVFSTKGGVGKSLVATNLAVALADQGSTVCLVDLDVNSGDVAIMLQLTPQRTLNDLAAFNGDDRRRAAVESLLTRTPRTCPSWPRRCSSTRRTRPRRGRSASCSTLLESHVRLRRGGHLRVFDDYALTALDRSDTLVLVGTLDIPALKGLKLATEHPRPAQLPARHVAASCSTGPTPRSGSPSTSSSRPWPQGRLLPVSSREVLAAVNRGEPSCAPTPATPQQGPQGASPRSLARRRSRRKVAAPADDDRRRATSAGRLRLRKALTWASPTDCAAAQRAAHRRDHSTRPAEPRAGGTGSVTRARPRQAAGRAGRRATPSATLKRVVHAQLVEALGPKLYDVAHDAERARAAGPRSRCRRAVADDRPADVRRDRTRISQEIADDILGYGPLEPLLRDPDLTEVMVNASTTSTSSAAASSSRSTPAFTDEAHLRRTIDKIVGKIGRRVDETSPMVDARLPDGSRVNAIIPPLALDGSKLTIRKFSEDPYTVEDLISFGTPHAPVGATCSRRASGAGSTSWSPAARAPARRPRSTCCRRSSPTTSAS